MQRATVSCDHVCRLLGVSQDGEKQLLVMRRYQMNLKQLADSRGGRIDLKSCLRYGLQVCRGMTDLHGQNIIMQDLKPQNILWDKQKDSVVISDFGVSKSMNFLAQSYTPREVVGTPNYIAPEAWTSNSVTVKSDVWSFGCLVIEACTGRAPWQGQTVEGIFRLLVTEQKNPSLDGLHPAIKQIVAKCLLREPVHRPTFQQLALDFEECLGAGVSDQGQLQSRAGGPPSSSPFVPPPPVPPPPDYPPPPTIVPGQPSAPPAPDDHSQHPADQPGARPVHPDGRPLSAPPSRSPSAGATAICWCHACGVSMEFTDNFCIECGARRRSQAVGQRPCQACGRGFLSADDKFCTSCGVESSATRTRDSSMAHDRADGERQRPSSDGSGAGEGWTGGGFLKGLATALNAAADVSESIATMDKQSIKESLVKNVKSGADQIGKTAKSQATQLADHVRAAAKERATQVTKQVATKIKKTTGIDPSDPCCTQTRVPKTEGFV
mmetsp:Transcript_44112/g.68971  ORF Transcript_44112/g.68971 Transcript_44112/m.68971 type:complete len:494 (+) Transcript_44112:82-1563(+)